MTRFEECLTFTLKWEGGVVDDPADRGGLTNQGVTQQTFSAYCVSHHLPPLGSVRYMTPSQRNGIYFEGYWSTMMCGGFPAGVDLVIFDYAVNSGPGRVMRIVRELTGGGKPMAAAALIAAICDERLNFLRSLTGWKDFGKGWELRVEDARRVAFEMHDRAAPQPPVTPAKFSLTTRLQGKLVERLASPSTWAGGGLGALLIQDYVHNQHLVHYILQAATAICAALAVIKQEGNGNHG